ncbi:MAG: alkaline phosphatase family protein [bacterium]
MKKFYQLNSITFLLSIFVLTISLAGCGPTEPEAEHGVFIITIDGLRPDILAKTKTPNIDNLKERGSYNMSALATVPTQTRVNFVTLPTGTHADKHGVVGSGYMNENWQYRGTDYPDYKTAQENIPVPTIFEVLERQKNMKTGYIATKGYELVGGRGASHQVKLENHLPEDVWKNRYERKVDGSEEKAIRYKREMDEVVLKKLKEAIRDEGVEMLIANFAALDYVGHQHGVEPEYTEAYRETIKKADGHIGEFLNFLEEGNYFKKHTIIFASDHGFTQIVNPENTILDSGMDEPDIPELGKANIEHSAMSRGGAAFSLYIRNKDRVEEAYEIIKDKDWIQNIYSEHDLPGLDGTLSELNYYNPPRTGEFFIDVKPAYTVGFTSRGQHGGTTEVNRQVPHVFVGEDFAENKKLESSKNVDIAPTVLSILGLDPDRHLQAQGRVLEEIIN